MSAWLICEINSLLNNSTPTKNCYCMISLHTVRSGIKNLTVDGD